MDDIKIPEDWVAKYHQRKKETTYEMISFIVDLVAVLPVFAMMIWDWSKRWIASKTRY